ncbi:MAG: pyridoxamine 5'-phosphate oxidase family protein, partial [Acidimicrobiales bacterium]
MTYYNENPTTRIRRHPERARYDREQVWAVLDEGLVAHVGFCAEEGPVVVPMVYARSGDTLYLHGSPAAGLLRALSPGARACVTVTLVDGLVLARVAFSHSLNYRSVMAFGQAHLVSDADEHLAALDLVVEHLVPGRTADLRRHTRKELAATKVVAFRIESASAKIRTGPPLDDEADLDEPVWAGVLPLRVVPGEPEADPKLVPGTPVPASVGHYRRP